MLKKGQEVVMYGCIEADVHNGHIWVCESDEFEQSGERVVFLKGYSGTFLTKYLQQLKLNEFLLEEEKQDQCLTLDVEIWSCEPCFKFFTVERTQDVVCCPTCQATGDSLSVGGIGTIKDIVENG